MARKSYKKGDTYGDSKVVKGFSSGSFIVKSKNGWHSLIVPNNYDGYWSVHTSRAIDGCINHHNKLLKMKLKKSW